MTRITIDIDEKDWLRAWSIWSILNYICMEKGCRAYIRETSRGYHVKAEGTGLDLKTTLKIREILGDDPVRLEIDKYLPVKPKNVLWTMKNNVEHGRWRRYPWD